MLQTVLKRKLREIYFCSNAIRLSFPELLVRLLDNLFEKHDAKLLHRVKCKAITATTGNKFNMISN